MKKQCVVIGLGIYGMNVAKKLSEEGMEVLAIDKDMKMVEKVGLVKFDFLGLRTMTLIHTTLKTIKDQG